MSLTTKPLRNIMATVAAAPLLCAAQVLAAPPAADDTPMEALGRSSTAILAATKPRIDAQGNAAFTIDISQLGVFRKLELAGSKYTALIFEGESKDKNRLCPFFNLTTRPYTIEEVRHDVFEVRTKVTPEETARVGKSGCAITTAPDRKKIKFLP